MKKPVLITLAVILSIGIGFYGSSLFFTANEPVESNPSMEFTRATLGQFLATQDQQLFLESSSTEFAAKMTTVQLGYILSALEALGEYQHIISIKPDTEKSIDMDEGAAVFLAMETAFQNASAILYVELIEENDGWKINNFTVWSQFLLVIAEPVNHESYS